MATTTADRAQKELVEKQKMEESQMYKQRQAHVQELRAQIREKEQQRIAERQAFFEEGFRLDEEAQARRARLDAVKRKKIQDLRFVCVCVCMCVCVCGVCGVCVCVCVCVCAGMCT